MLTEQIDSLQPNEATNSPRGFETRDFYLACFLRCSGYQLRDLRSEGRRKVFVFDDSSRRESDVFAFYSDHVTVPPLAFSSTIKQMKALLHNA